MKNKTGDFEKGHSVNSQCKCWSEVMDKNVKITESDTDDNELEDVAMSQSRRNKRVG